MNGLFCWNNYYCTPNELGFLFLWSIHSFPEKIIYVCIAEKHTGGINELTHYSSDIIDVHFFMQYNSLLTIIC